MPRRLLSDDQVMGILADHDRGMHQLKIARKYGTSRATVHLIVTGQSHREAVARYEADRDGTTEAELDALIAAQLPTMPREPRLPGEAQLPHAVLRGLGVRASGLNQRRTVAP